MIYLDYASNTPADPAVLQAFCQAEGRYIANPSAHHLAGEEAGRRMEEITAGVASLLGVSLEQIIFTSGASEANNLALKGMARSYRHSGRHILSTCLEHPSVSGPLSALQEQGYEVELIDVRSDGAVDLEHLRELLRPDTALVSVCWVDSELGTVQPIREIAEMIREYPGCRLHVDATQAVGRVPVDPEGVHCLTFAPHKFYGLNGCGVLLKGKDVALEPLIHGGTGASPYRSGTPALALAASVQTALERALERREERWERVAQLRRVLESGLEAYPLVQVNSPQNGVPHILNLSVKGVKGDAFQAALSRRGVCVSVKSACSTQGTPSRPVFAVTRDKGRARCSWRVSLSHLTTEEELRGFLQAFDQCYGELTI